MANRKLTRYILHQIIFWVAAYILLASIILLAIKSSELSLGINLWVNLCSSVVMGTLQGIAFGLTEFMLERTFIKRQSLGLNIIARVLIYLVETIFILALFRLGMSRYLDHLIQHRTIVQNTIQSWRYIFYLTMIYNVLMSLVIIFILQVSRKFGPKMMLPMLLGKYRTPKEEYRLFIFMDLHGSTTIAEKLGHIQYSELIRDCILDINSMVYKNHGQIYQYVGDEVVVTWLVDKVMDYSVCLDFFFDCQSKFEKRSSYYQNRYNFQPSFKAGAHVGRVTAVEIGDVKRDIAFHGDTLNITARLQSLCNEYHQQLLISSALAKHISQPNYQVKSLGLIQLKGKSMYTEVYSVETINKS